MAIVEQLCPNGFIQYEYILTMSGEYNSFQAREEYVIS